MGVAHIDANTGRGDAGRVGAVFHALQDVAEHDQPGLIGKGQRPQQHSLDDGEDGGGGADAEGQRQHRGQRESRRLEQLTQRIAHVLQ